MSTLPALPTPPYESAESQLAQLLQRACSDGQRAKLALSQLTSGEWSLSASIDLSAAQLEGALREASKLDIFAVPSDEDEVENAVVQMKAMTSRPVWMDAEDAAAYETALIEACRGYPLDVVQTACKAWRLVPNQGKWWPTEQDLRQQCENIFRPRRALWEEANNLLRSLKAGEESPRQSRSMHPTGRVREFIERVRAHPHLGQPFVKSYLSDLTCDFSANTIFVAYSTQAERIPQRCAEILRDFPGLKIVHDRLTTERCNRDQDAMGNTYTPSAQGKRKWNT